LNESILRSFNALPDSLGPFLRFFSEGINTWPVRVILGLFLLALVYKPGATRRAGVQSLIAFLIANGLTDLFKHLTPELRPCAELANVATHGIGCNPHSMGTASAHAANMAAVAFVFVYQLGWFGSPWIAIALITGVSRVYVAAHYPYQVLLGYLCGIAAAALVTMGWRRIGSRWQKSPPQPNDA